MVSQVCASCVSKPSTCKPTWHLNNKSIAVQCMNCMAGKRGCSFKDFDFGIIKLPSLRKMEAGNLRRAEQVLAKHKGGQKKAPVDDDVSVPIIAEPSASVMTREKWVGLRAPEMRKAASEGAPTPLVIPRQEHEYAKDRPTIVAQGPDIPKLQTSQDPGYIRMSGREE